MAMEVQDWGGGLTQREIEAIDKIKKAFQKTNELKIEKNNNKGFEALKALKSIFPWKGYSGFRFVDSQRNEGEFDLVIVTHCNVIIVELKDWNGSKVTSINDRWYLGNQERGRSAVSVTRNKKFLLERKLDKLKDKFTNKGFRPFVEFFVVMTGTADFRELPANEKNHVLSLNDFLEIRNEEVFNKLFKTHSNSKTLNQDFAIFDELVFGINKVKPKNIGFGGYYAEGEPSFKHPSNIYREFIAHSEQNKQKDIALLRHWDFTQVDRKEAQTPDGRFSLVSREYDVLQHIKNTNQQLYQSCLSYKSMPQKGELTSEHIDLFEIFSQQKRFNEFVGGYNGNNLSQDRRIGLVKILLDKFAQLHKLGIAHRDLGSHSLWLSSDDKVTLSGFTTAYFSSEESVGDIREILAVSGDLAKETFPTTTGQSLSPYQLDIRSLAVLAWHIIHAERISPHSLAKMQSNLATDNEWYSAILLKALSENTFDQANDFLTAFTEAQPESAFDFNFNFANLDSFYHEIQLFRTYPETEELLVENDIKEVYRSSNLLIKSWLGTDPKKDVNQARVVFKWLQDIARLAQLNLDYVPQIREFGIARKSGSLFIASEFIEGFDWTKIVELNLPETYKFVLIDKLIQNIEHLHSSGYVHGDLKPSNIVITLDEKNENDANIYLLDILDFSMDDDYFNTEYSPLFDSATAKQRDNFAVIKMSCELLNIDLNSPTEQYQNISEVIALENSDSKVGYISLARFKDALKPKPKSPTLDI